MITAFLPVMPLDLLHCAHCLQGTPRCWAISDATPRCCITSRWHMTPSESPCLLLLPQRLQPVQNWSPLHLDPPQIFQEELWPCKSPPLYRILCQGSSTVPPSLHQVHDSGSVGLWACPWWSVSDWALTEGKWPVSLYLGEGWWWCSFICLYLTWFPILDLRSQKGTQRTGCREIVSDYFSSHFESVPTFCSP